jgi:hypothetical protein
MASQYCEVTVVSHTPETSKAFHLTSPDEASSFSSWHETFWENVPSGYQEPVKSLQRHLLHPTLFIARINNIYIGSHKFIHINFSIVKILPSAAAITT